MARMETYLLQIAFWLTLVLGGLALVLTLLGLFSVLSYLVEQRRKEIGVRMALGATTRNVGRLVLAQSVRPVGFGHVAGGSLAGALGIVLMATPAASQIGDIVHVFDPAAYAASMLCFVAACALAALIPALRAARIDPIATLRQSVAKELPASSSQLPACGARLLLQRTLKVPDGRHARSRRR